MITETRTTNVYVITHEELVEAYLKWNIKAEEENWPESSGSHEEAALELADTLVGFLNQ